MYVPKPKKQKSGNYFIQLRLGGQSVSITARTEKECKRRAELTKAEYLSGKREMNGAPCDLTLRQAIDRYILARSNILSPSTIYGYRMIQKNRFQRVMDCPVAQVKDWQALVNEAAAHLAAKTVTNDWRFIGSVLKESGVAVPRVMLPQIVPNDHPYLTPPEIRVFVAALGKEPCQIPALLALHSLRRSEIIGLTWKDVDLKNGIIHVRGAAVYGEGHKLIDKPTNKNRSSRRDIPIMIPQLSAALQKIPAKERSGRIVTCDPNTIWKQINRVCENNGLPKVGVHGLRHSFASLAFCKEVGMTEREVMEIGGWASSQTVHKIYEHLTKENRIKAGNRMGAFYAEKPIGN